MQNQEYYMAFSHCLNLGPITFAKLIDYFGSVEKAYTSSEAQLKHVISPAIVRDFLDFRRTFSIIEKQKELHQKQIHILHKEHRLYPPQLLTMPDAPICLYVKGNVENYDFTKQQLVAIVGTRAPSTYGEYVAAEFSFALAQRGIVIVSGMAHGIDGISHRAAIKAKGKTIAVLGCGVDLPYPAAHRTLYNDIISSGGLVVSEFPPGMTPQKGTFVARNRIVSGLSQGVFVVEGKKNSGSLITARFAADQGKEVFAPPVPLNSQVSQAPNMLLKQGAVLVTEVEDILSALHIPEVMQQSEQLSIVENLSEEERAICEQLQREPLLADNLAQGTLYPIEKVLTLISCLELQGIVERNSEGKYCLV